MRKELLKGLTTNSLKQ